MPAQIFMESRRRLCQLGRRGVVGICFANSHLLEPLHDSRVNQSSLFPRLACKRLAHASPRQHPDFKEFQGSNIGCRNLRPARKYRTVPVLVLDQAASCGTVAWRQPVAFALSSWVQQLYFIQNLHRWQESSLPSCLLPWTPSA